LTELFQLYEHERSKTEVKGDVAASR